MTDPYKSPMSNAANDDQDKIRMLSGKLRITMILFLFIVVLVVITAIILMLYFVLDAAQEYFSVNLRPIKGVVIPLLSSILILSVRSKVDVGFQGYLKTAPIFLIVCSVIIVLMQYIIG